MRITNAMMTNTTLINLNRNMRYLDGIIQQIESTKKIQVPSDDPIIASRALKFRTNLAEVEQFQRNVQSGLAWMNVTESSFTNVVENILKQVRERCVEAATGTETSSDKMAIVAELREMIDQIGLEMNQTYAGRYVFSGFRTDQPPVLPEANANTYVITQTFSLTDIEKTKSYQKVVDGTPPVLTDEPIVHNINVLKLAYKDVKDINIPGYDVVTVPLSDASAYDPAALNGVGATGKPILHYIPETGELVMSNDTAASFPASGVDISYTKTGFQKGELNPLVYFDCRDISTAPASVDGNVYQMSQTFNLAAATPDADPPTQYTYQLAYGDLDSLVLSDNALTLSTGPVPAPPANDVVYYDAATGMLTMNTHTAQVLQSKTITYTRTFTASDTTPFANTAVESPALVSLGDPLVPDPSRYYNMEGQNIQYEFSSHTYVSINSLSKNVFTDKMYADLKSICDFAESLTTSDPKLLEEKYANPPHNLTGEDLTKAVNDQITNENAQLQAVLYDRFNNMLYLVDRHSANAMKEHTQLGSRMSRLDLLGARLEQDEASYTQLLSDNEDADLVELIVLRASAEAAYQAALKVGANIVQMTLANFIG